MREFGCFPPYVSIRDATHYSASRHGQSPDARHACYIQTSRVVVPMKFLRTAASLSLILMMSTWVAHADGSTETLTPQTVTRFAKVAGSVIQATMRSVDKATPCRSSGTGRCRSRLHYHGLPCRSVRRVRNPGISGLQCRRQAFARMPR